MNGRIVKSALHPCRQFIARNLRALLLTVCCLMSLALLGAVRARSYYRPEPVGAITPPVLAAWTEQKAAVRPLPENAELLRSTTVEPAAEPVASIALPRVTPTLIRPTPRVRKMLMEVTAYCACTKCCGPRARGITASGKRVSYNGGRFVAADTKLLKFNTKLLVPGYADGQPVEVIDRGGAIKGAKLDVYFDSHQEARKWGRQWLVVTVLE